MRAIMVGLALGLLLVITGCPPTQQNLVNPSTRPPADLPKPPEPAQLVKYLNDNAARIDGIQSVANMECKEGSQSVDLGGYLNASRPRNFRLTGKVVGTPAVDVGSNDNEFWFWIKAKNEQGQSPVYHCSYADLARGPVRLPFPFQPDMIMAALGIQQYDPNKPYTLRASPKYLELVEPTTSPQGQPMEKVTVFNRLEVKPPQPQVVAHRLLDRQGKVVCQASIARVVYNQQTGAVVPQEVILSWPEQKMSMNLILNRPQVVTFDQAAMARLFQRTNLTMPGFDLARGRPDDAGLQRTGLR
jgi:hypothetical protein